RSRLPAGAGARAHRSGARRGSGARARRARLSRGARRRRRVKRRRVDASLWILLALVVLAIAVAFARDAALPWRGVVASVGLRRGVWIELALGFLLAGLLEVLIPRPVLSRWLGGGQLRPS